MCLTSAEGRKKNESFDLFITKLSINQPAYRNMETGYEMGNYCYNHNLWLAVSKKKKHAHIHINIHVHIFFLLSRAKLSDKI